MAEQSDEIGVSVTGALDAAANSGALSIQTKSRFLGAADRLLGAILDLPAAWIDSWKDSNSSSAEIKREFRELQAKLVREALDRKADYEARLLQLRAAAELRELEHTLNIAAVVGESARLLQDGGSGSEGVDEEDAPTQLDDDWLNRFQQYAGAASSHDLRHTWARILQGEIVKPGSYSAAALRFVAELDKSMAERCEQIARRLIAGGMYPTDAEQRGTALHSALSLQAAGLLTGVGGLLSQERTMGESGVTAWTAGDYVLMVKAPPDTKFSTTLYLETDLGREIFSLLEQPDHKANLRLLFDVLPKHDVTEAHIHHLSPDTGGGRLTLSVEALLISTG